MPFWELHGVPLSTNMYSKLNWQSSPPLYIYMYIYEYVRVYLNIAEEAHGTRQELEVRFCWNPRICNKIYLLIERTIHKRPWRYTVAEI